MLNQKSMKSEIAAKDAHFVNAVLYFEFLKIFSSRVVVLKGSKNWSLLLLMWWLLKEPFVI